MQAGDYTGPTDFEILFAEYIAGALQERGVVARVVQIDSETPTSVDYVFDGDLLAIDPGSWNLRFWIGLGAGRGLINARGRLTEVRTGDVLINETLRARSNTWQFQENILRRICSKIARSFAKKVEVAISRK